MAEELRRTAPLGPSSPENMTTGLRLRIVRLRLLEMYIRPLHVAGTSR